VEREEDERDEEAAEEKERSSKTGSARRSRLSGLVVLVSVEVVDPVRFSSSVPFQLEGEEKGRKRTKAQPVPSTRCKPSRSTNHSTSSPSPRRASTTSPAAT
jgi:hypothetical protein